MLEVLDYLRGNGFQVFIVSGRQPIACFGNSDGDREMLEWTTLGPGTKAPRLGLIVHHTDADREFACQVP